jgi:hypothetical protein
VDDVVGASLLRQIIQRLQITCITDQLASLSIKTSVSQSYLARPQYTGSELVHSESFCRYWGGVAQLRAPDRTGSHRSREDSLGNRSYAGEARGQRHDVSQDSSSSRSGIVRSKVRHPAQCRRRGDTRVKTGGTHRSHRGKEGTK